MTWLASITTRLLAYALALAFAFCGWWLWWGARDDLIAYRAEVQALGKQAKADADAQDSEWRSQLEEARNAAKKREATLSAALADARSEHGRMRDEITRLSQLPVASADAERQGAERARAALGECDRVQQDLARELDGRESDLRTLIDAWPR